MEEVLAARRVYHGLDARSIDRSTSQDSLFPKPHEDRANARLENHTTKTDTITSHTTSIYSSPPSSPRLSSNDMSSQVSYISTPSSSLSLDEDYCDSDEEEEVEEEEGDDDDDDNDDDEEIAFPSLDPHSDPYSRRYNIDGAKTFGDDAVSGSILATKERNSLEQPLNSPAQAELIYQSAGDDTALVREPSRHVDYLSHDWREEDIWSSWRHIVSRRKQLENFRRLENASWRSWAKARNHLKTVSPEKLNWMKDHDVTWLYGPLQTTEPQTPYLASPVHLEGASRSSSFLSKKPILKKRSVSEVMLQRSLSNSTLVRQAVDALAHQNVVKVDGRPRFATRAASYHGYDRSSVANKITPGGSYSSCVTSTVESGVQTPSVDKRHIHFNNKVEQCIAINKEVDELEDRTEVCSIDDDDTESSDDGVLMVQSESSIERKLNSINTATKTTPLPNNTANKTIAMLPSTTLNCRGDTPEPSEQRHDRIGNIWETGRRLLSHASSSETLRPTRSSGNFLLDDDDDDEMDMSWQPQTIHSNSKSVQSSSNQYSLQDAAMEDEEMESRGLRRTPSGMFMPFEDEDVEDVGIVGKVLDTVNTARDIAHVIWNVGWRR